MWRLRSREARRAVSLLLCAALAGCGAHDTLAPEQWTGYVPPAASRQFEIRVRLAQDPPSLERIDILLLFDVTQSMREVIDEVRANAGTIMRAIRAGNPNSAFGVASFADYQERMPWRLDRDITEDMDSISAAITRLRLYDGKDFPEAYSRALYEARFIGWRPGARRFIILFGDAPAHDPNFYGQSTGIDPGRDGIPGTEDDLRFAEVVRDLAVDRITVLVNYVPGDPLARKGFEFLAAQTGGAAIPVSDAKQVSTAIVTGLNEQSFARPSIVVPPAFADWVRVSDGKRTREGDLREYVYSVNVSVPPRATAGIRRFPLFVQYADATRSVEIGTTQRHDPHGLAVPPGVALAAGGRGACWCCYGGCAAPGVAAPRFLHNRQLARLFLRLLGFALFALLIYIGWRHFEGAERSCRPAGHHLLPHRQALRRAASADMSRRSRPDRVEASSAGNPVLKQAGSASADDPGLVLASVPPHSASGCRSGAACSNASSFRHSSLMRTMVGKAPRSTLKRLALATCGTSTQSANPGASPWQKRPVPRSSRQALLQRGEAGLDPVVVPLQLLLLGRGRACR